MEDTDMELRFYQFGTDDMVYTVRQGEHGGWTAGTDKDPEEVELLSWGLTPQEAMQHAEFPAEVQTALAQDVLADSTLHPNSREFIAQHEHGGT